MELKFNEDVKIPQKIEFNFEELKREVMTKSDHYKNMVYTDDTIKDAKADKADQSHNPFCFRFFFTGIVAVK